MGLRSKGENLMKETKKVTPIEALEKLCNFLDFIADK